MNLALLMVLWLVWAGTALSAALVPYGKRGDLVFGVLIAVHLLVSLTLSSTF